MNLTRWEGGGDMRNTGVGKGVRMRWEGGLSEWATRKLTVLELEPVRNKLICSLTCGRQSQCHISEKGITHDASCITTSEFHPYPRKVTPSTASRIMV
jgi:hypothetical protein